MLCSMFGFGKKAKAEREQKRVLQDVPCPWCKHATGLHSHGCSICVCQILRKELDAHHTALGLGDEKCHTSFVRRGACRKEAWHAKGCAFEHCTKHCTRAGHDRHCPAGYVA
jgi:hypothetical protein